MRSRTVAFATATVAVLLGACTQNADPVIRQANILMSEPYDRAIIGQQTEISGQLNVSEEGCVSLRTAGGEFPVWAMKGSSLDDSGTAVIFAQVGQFALGDKLTVPGGVRTIAAPSQELRPKGYRECFSATDRARRQITAAFVEWPANKRD